MSSIIHPIKNEVADHAGRPFSHCVGSGARPPRSDMLLFDPFHDSPLAARREERERLADVFASMGGRRGRLEYGNNVCIFRRRRSRRGGGITIVQKPDLIPSSDAAIAAFVDLAAVKCRRYGYQGRKPKAQAPRSLLFPFFFCFFVGGGLTDHLYRWNHSDCNFVRILYLAQSYWVESSSDAATVENLIWETEAPRKSFILGDDGWARFQMHGSRAFRAPPSTSCWRCPWSKRSPSLVQLSRKAGGSDAWRCSQGQMKHYKRVFFFFLSQWEIKGKDWCV